MFCNKENIKSAKIKQSMKMLSTKLKVSKRLARKKCESANYWNFFFFLPELQKKSVDQMRRRNELRLLLQFDFSRKKRKQANEFVVPVDQKSL